jgi:hypothetical protein
MQSPEHPVGLPLDYAAELAFELHLLRGECGDLAREIVNCEHPDEIALEECAQLEDALAKSQGILGATLKTIKALRDKRASPGA